MRFRDIVVAATPRRLRPLARRVAHRLGLERAPASVTPSPGPIITETLPTLLSIPGWFNYDDVVHFSLILAGQDVASLKGNMLEIGCYHGRASALMARFLRPEEELLAVDLFERAREAGYSDCPDMERVRRTILSAAPNVTAQQITLLNCSSHDMQLNAEKQFRFAHIDGGHDMLTVTNDLNFVATRMVPGGVVAVDDYAHPMWPDIKPATDRFLAANSNAEIFADLNRSTSLGRKLYIVFR